MQFKAILYPGGNEEQRTQARGIARIIIASDFHSTGDLRNELDGLANDKVRVEWHSTGARTDVHFEGNMLLRFDPL